MSTLCNYSEHWGECKGERGGKCKSVGVREREEVVSSSFCILMEVSQTQTVFRGFLFMVVCERSTCVMVMVVAAVAVAMAVVVVMVMAMLMTIVMLVVVVRTRLVTGATTMLVSVL